jgi:hypothetical protein
VFASLPFLLLPLPPPPHTHSAEELRLYDFPLGSVALEEVLGVDKGPDGIPLSASHLSLAGQVRYGGRGGLRGCVSVGMGMLSRHGGGAGCYVCVWRGPGLRMEFGMHAPRMSRCEKRVAVGVLFCRHCTVTRELKCHLLPRC